VCFNIDGWLIKKDDDCWCLMLDVCVQYMVSSIGEDVVTLNWRDNGEDDILVEGEILKNRWRKIQIFCRFDLMPGGFKV
jgi:hypothetical protein